jgi:succinate dehydrogenase/fumarate reductase cytochrome b subunit
MAGNTQMNDNERGLFSLVHGITGGLIATVLLLSILAFLTINSFAVQKENATNFYSINQDINGLKAVAPSSEQYKNYTDAK